MREEEEKRASLKPPRKYQLERRQQARSVSKKTGRVSPARKTQQSSSAEKAQGPAGRKQTPAGSNGKTDQKQTHAGGVGNNTQKQTHKTAPVSSPKSRQKYERQAPAANKSGRGRGREDRTAEKGGKRPGREDRVAEKGKRSGTPPAFTAKNPYATHEDVLRKKRRIEKKPRFSAAALILPVLTLGFFIMLSRYPRQVAELKRLEDLNKSLHKELEQLDAEERDIEELAELTGSEDFIEKLAREELGLIKPDEIIFTD